MQAFILMQIDRHAYLYMGLLQILCIRFFANAKKDQLLVLAFILLAISFAVLSNLISKKASDKEHTTQVVFSKRQANQLLILSILCLVTSISTFLSFYRSEKYARELLLEGTVSFEGLIVLDASETSFGYTELILRADSQTGIRLLVQTEEEFLHGDMLHARLDLRALERAKNPGAFDEHSYRQSLGIHLNASLVQDEEFVKEEHLAYRYRLQRYAKILNDRICNFFVELFGKQHGGLASAMLLGNEAYLSKDVKDDFKLSGLSHLLVVSGSNVSLVFTFLLPLVANSSLSFTARQCILLPGLVFFGALINWDASVTRAIGMNIVIILAKLFRRPITGSTSLGIAVCFILAFHPRSALQMGFLMSSVVSFALMHVLKDGVLCIKEHVLTRFSLERWWICIGDAKQKLYTSLLYAILTPFISQIAVLPFTISLGSESTWLAVALNWFAVPLAGVLTLLLSIISPLFLIPVIGSKVLSLSLTKPIHMLLIVLDWLSTVPRVFNVQTFILSPQFIYLYILLLFLCLAFIYSLKKKMVIKTALLYLITLSLVTGFRFYKRPDLRVTFFAIGQGDSALLEFKSGARILIDTGTKLEGERILLPAFRALGIKKLDAVILSHMHLDHCGAITCLMEEQLVSSIYSPPLNTDQYPAAREERAYQEDLMNIAKRDGINWFEMDRSTVLEIGEKFNIRCIHPDAKDVSGGNASSLVLELTGLGIKFLFTGDIEKNEEQLLVDQGLLSSVDVLKVSHHGSNTSSSAAFLDVVNPSFSVISVGKNIYGHPHLSVLQSLEERNSTVFRTDEDGALLIEVTTRGWTIYRYMDKTVRWKGN